MMSPRVEDFLSRGERGSRPQRGQTKRRNRRAERSERRPVSTERLREIVRTVHHTRQVKLLGTNLGKTERAPETLRRGAMIFQAPLQFPEDGVQQVVRFETFALRNRRHGIET